MASHTEDQYRSACIAVKAAFGSGQTPKRSDLMIVQKLIDENVKGPLLSMAQDAMRAKR